MDTQHIWEEFSDNVHGFIRKRVNNEHDADDILQDVFRKIHDNLHKVADDTKIPGWIFQIARNTIVDHYRSNSRNNNISIDDEHDLLRAGDEEEDNLNETVAFWLRGMIEDLPDKYREAIHLTELQGLTQIELANRMGISLSGAKSRVQRGREKLKEMLLDCCHLEFDRLGNVIDYTRNESCCSRREPNSTCESSCEPGA